MNFIGGIILIALSVVMILLARPSANGEPPAFLRNWLLGQLYAFVAMLMGLGGVAIIITKPL